MLRYFKVIKAIIFDLDGTIVDSKTAWLGAFKITAKKFGFDYSESLSHLTRGIGIIKSAKNLTAHYGIPHKSNEFLQTAKNNYKKLFFEKVTLMPGALDLLAKLNTDYKIALASSSPRFVLEANFTKFPELNKYFGISVAGDEVERTKPSPDIFLLASKKLAVEPKKCLVIEDSPTGVAAAKTAGMKCIGLLDPGPKKQGLSKADKKVQVLSEITPSLINSL